MVWASFDNTSFLLSTSNFARNYEIWEANQERLLVNAHRSWFRRRIAALDEELGTERNSCTNRMTFITKNWAQQRNKWLDFMFRGRGKKSQQQNKPVSKLHLRKWTGFIHVLFEISSAPHKSWNIPEALSLTGNTNPFVLQLLRVAQLLCSLNGSGEQKYSHPQPKYQRVLCSKTGFGTGIRVPKPQEMAPAVRFLPADLRSMSKLALDCHHNSLRFQNMCWVMNSALL